MKNTNSLVIKSGNQRDDLYLVFVSLVDWAEKFQGPCTNIDSALERIHYWQKIIFIFLIRGTIGPQI